MVSQAFFKKYDGKLQVSKSTILLHTVDKLFYYFESSSIRFFILFLGDEAQNELYKNLFANYSRSMAPYNG